MDPFPASLIILFLIIASGIFSLFDYALCSCRKTRLEKENSKLYRSVLNTYENPQKLSLACKLWINILRIFAAFFFGMIAMQKLLAAQNSFGIAALTTAVSVLALGLIAALIGDALPKLISRVAPEKLLPRC